MKPVVKKLLVILTIIFTLIYNIWRVFFTIPFHFGIVATIAGIALVAVELMGFFEMAVHFQQLSNIREPKKPDVTGKEFPDVDIFISTYNEPQDLLYKTVNGCIHMDYPDQSKVHIYLCDDGHRDEMGVLAKQMGVTHLVRDTHKDAKAGNLNFALSQSTSPYIVTFDADMIPKHDFLIENMPYFMGEEEIGFLQTPQTFYNPDLFQYNLYSEDRIPNEQDYFYKDVQVMRNASNSVIYGGTNTIISRKALEDAGGFYTGVITEDFATGMVIQSKGYQCYAIKKSYASGMAPEDLQSLVKQRQRWARGCIQTGRKVNIIFRKGLSFSQKVSYITSITYWYGALKRFIYLMSPILYAVFGVIVVKCTLWQVLAFWLPMYLLNNITLRSLSGNIRNTRLTNIYDTILFPGLLLAVILETFGISQKKFVVTKKDTGKKLESNDKMYKFKRSILLFIMLILSAIGMGKCIYFTFAKATPMYVVIMFWLLVNLFNIIMALFFMFGRRPHRRYERFDAVIDCIVQFDNRIIRTKTTNISEKGVSIELDFPEYITAEEEVVIKLSSDLYHTVWKGRVANVFYNKGKWHYGFELTDITEDEKKSMLQLVYDREPTLPKEIDAGLSTVDDIMVNIVRRTVNIPYFSRKLPRININSKIKDIDGNRYMLEDFNYEYLTLTFIKGITPPQNLVLEHQGIRIKCTLTDINMRYGSCYKIENTASLAGNIAFRSVLKSWMIDQEFGENEEETYKKKVMTTLQKPPIFDELDYL